ncbi:hypothetical protein [Streptomyces sp. NPDC059564]|uniref:hypothetical protein n=1 Tax=Streptomyces sp. NPDC059564 TaxID=3346865 RepID=UPI00367BBD6A
MRDLTRLELITEAARAALEEAAGTSPHLLDELVDEDWGRRYGRPVRPGKNPTKPKTRILALLRRPDPAVLAGALGDLAVLRAGRPHLAPAEGGVAARAALTRPDGPSSPVVEGPAPVRG